MIPQYWQEFSPYHSYSIFMKKKFGERLQKISVNAGMTCPNRDGKISKGGCIYCSNEAFCPSYCTANKTILQQIDEGIQFHKTRYRRVHKYLVYFQPYTNTYGETKKIISLFEEALSHKEVFGLVIGTRPDCINQDILKYLGKKNETYPIFLEFGVETFNNDILTKINRGHSSEVSINAIELSKKYDLHTCIHIILGLPWQSREECLEQVKIINKLPIDNIKFHQLQIMKNTKLAELYLKDSNFVTLFEFNEYVDFVIRFLELLRPEIVVERLVAEIPPRFLLTGTFGSLRNDEIIRLIEKEMKNRNSYQGKFYTR